MFERKPKPPEGPTLLDRIVETGCRRIGILGLHPHAGTRTVLAALVRDLHRRSWPFGVTSAPRLPIEESEADTPQVTRVAIPEGAFVATAEQTSRSGDALMALIERAPFKTTAGMMGLYRVERGGEVDLHGPGEAEPITALLRRLGDLSGGMVFIDGGWERRAFAAPGVTDGVVLVLGAGFSPTIERAAAAARYVVETLSAPPCDEPARIAWKETASGGAACLLDASGKAIGVLPPGLEDPIPALKTPDGSPVGAVVLPFGLNDEMMIPLVRSSFRTTLVVRDPTRINVSPVYYKAWLKGRGRIQVVRTVRLLAVATNPFNPLGPDADAEAFRQRVSTALPELPVHDVVLESHDDAPKPLWKFWE